MAWQRGWTNVVGLVGVFVFAGAAASQCGPVPGGGGATTTTTTTTTTSTTAPPSITTTTVKSGTPIGPDQHYLGLVNGKNTNATITVVCPGPAGGERTGPPAGGQSVAVTQVAAGGGNTGSMGHELWAQFGADLFHVVAFATYDSPATIPTTLQLPCEGTGTVDFTTCFGTLPCAADAADNVVTVTFVNIAA